MLRVEDIYTQEILELSSQVPTNSRLDNPDVTITKGTPICGSIMTVDLNLKDGMIDDIGLEIRSCALGKASASIFVKNAKGLNLDDVKKVKKDFDELEITLKYHEEKPVIKEISRESKPGLRKYVNYKDIKPYKGGLGIKLLTTSKGILTDSQAIKNQVGGEIICRVF